MADETKCSCSGNCIKLVFPCSGVADVGELADRVGRKLNKEGSANMYCLAGIGGNVSGIIESTKAANKILVVDGCPVECAKKTLLEKGITKFEHIVITSQGHTKGKTEINEANINKIADKCREVL